MKASELDKGLSVKDPSATDAEERSYYIPPQSVPVYKAYQKVGQNMKELSTTEPGIGGLA